ncbi:hypothetical protein ZOSMA_221G00260, partial [Zostera marina]
CQKSVHEQLTWASKSDIKYDILNELKELGSILYWIGLLDTVLKENELEQFIQTAPWLGFLPGNDGQIKQTSSGDSPAVNLFKSATTAITSNNNCSIPSYFNTMSKQAEAADMLYRTNISTGSVLEYALAFTSAALEKHYSKWSAPPRTGYLDITTSKDFYRIFSGLQFEYLEEIAQDQINNDLLGDSIAWSGCTIMYLLGQQLHFELFDFSYQFLNVAEVETAVVMQTASSEKTKNLHYLQGYENLLEAMKKSRRLNNYVFSMLKARCPLEDKVAYGIKQSGAPLPRIQFANTISAFETLPQKGA